MKLRKRTVLVSAVLLLLAAGVLALPAVHWRLIGWVRDEAFYQGRPTSYWSGRIEEWTGSRYWSSDSRLSAFPSQSRWDRSCAAIGLSADMPNLRPEVLGGGRDVNWKMIPPNHDVLEDEAVPVLIELLRDENQWVRQAAIRAFVENNTTNRQMVPALLDTALNADPPTRRTAAAAVWQLDMATAYRAGLPSE
jgi:hypothetical protein